MKNTVLIGLLVLLVFASSGLFSQNRNGYFAAYDRFGNELDLEKLAITSSNPLGSITSINAVPTISCSSGYFIAYYAPGSMWDINNSAQTVLCTVLKDISNFLGSSLSTSVGVGPKIRLYCSDTPTNAPGALGAASAVHVFPLNPANPNQGILDNQIYKMIISGVDSYTNVPSTFFNSNAFYHGYVLVNPNPNGGTWNMNLSNTNVSASEFCLYTLLLHELTHSLGFASLIGPDGNSLFGASHNHYSRYDQFLKSPGNTPLISSTSTVSPPCLNSDVVFTSSLVSVICSATTGCVQNVSTCSTAVQYSSSNVNVKVYTPNCYEYGSSLSHFEDMCPIPSTVNLGCATNTNLALNNDKYYVMANAAATGSCYVRRSLTDEERYVLCDLGYSVSSVYGSTVAGSNYTYTGSCSGPNIWGLNDGFSNGAFTNTAIVSSGSPTTIVITFSTLIGNDSPNTVSVTCVEMVTNNPQLGFTSSATSATIHNNATVPGLVVLKYYPVNSTGVFGNATYVFAYFLPAGCTPADPCNMVQNGGFENYSGTSPCGQMLPGAPPTFSAAPSCWTARWVTPDYFVRSCTLSPGGHNLGTNTWGLTNPAVDSFNGSPNNGAAGLGAVFSYTNVSIDEEIETTLSNALSPGNTYQISLWALNPSAYGSNSATAQNAAPVVISVNSFPSIGSFGNDNILCTFTVNPSQTWSQFTNTFVFTPTVGHLALSINTHSSTGLFNTITTPSISYNTYFYFDEISLLPLPSSTIQPVTFVIPNANACGNSTLSNLAQYASTTGTFTGTGVTYTNGVYSFTATTPGAYPIAFNYTTTSGCTLTLWQSYVVSPPVTINTIGPNVVCSNFSVSATTLTASASCGTCANSYIWLPGNLLGAVQSFTPSSTSIYTIVVNSGSCTTSNTVAIIVSTNCCTSTITPYAFSAINSSLSGSNVFNGNVTVLPFTNAVITGQAVFAPNVKITVPNNAQLTIEDAHLYSCSDMWQGIEVLDGGKLFIKYHSYCNLIEDAKMAVDISNHATSSATMILEASYTTFNRNYISINISNYQRASITYSDVIKVNNCVFTSRNLPFTATQWVQAFANSSATTTAAELRTEITSTAGFSSPYIVSAFTFTTLKPPYSSQPSHIAINISTVGITTGPIATTNGTASMFGIRIGDKSSATNFNLFDSHGNFIVAKKSNVTVENNVFQNTKLYSGGGNGSAVKHSAGYTSTDVMHTMLNMYGGSKITGNRFWDCHKGIDIDRTYLFWLENSTMRSTQSSATVSAFGPGNTGIYASTNNFDYYVNDCEFSNLQTAINIPVFPGLIAPSPGVPWPATIGIFAHRIRVSSCAFGTGTVTNGYMDKVFDLTAPNPNWLNSTLVVPGITVGVSPFVEAFAITNNTMTNVFRGVSVNGSNGFQFLASDNKITLIDDNIITPGSDQYGVRLVNSTPYSNVYVGQNVITSNDISFASSTSYTTGGLIYCGDNGYGVQSPSVTCNSLTKGYNGFVFDGINMNATWMGNDMTTPMDRGFVLSHTAAIGVQGGTTYASANRWVGGTGAWTNTYYGTHVGANTLAQNSFLYVSSSGASAPPNNQSAIPGQDFGSTNSYATTSGGGDYTCGDFPNAKIIVPEPGHFSSDIAYYKAIDAFYRFNNANDSVRNSDIDVDNFYTSLSGSSVDYFHQIDVKLYQNDVEGATDILTGMDDSGFNAVETNYKTFFLRYIAYLNEPTDRYPYDDSSSLRDLAMLCPGDNGAPVYKAIALYNTIYGKILTPDCSASYARNSHQNDKESIATSLEGISNIRIFPNPAKDQITIQTPKSNEDLVVEIKDLSDRIVVSRTIKATGFFVNLDLNLINGVYLITVKNSQRETVTKKLVISK